MSRQAKWNNAVIFAIALEFRRLVAAMPIEYQHPIRAFCPRFCIIMEMLNPIQTCFVICPSFGGGFYAPGFGKTALCIPIREMVGAFNDEIWGHVVAVATDAANCSRPFSIARLYFFASSASFGPGYNHMAANLTHHKTGFVEIVNVAILDAVFGLYIGHQLKPRV